MTRATSLRSVHRLDPGKLAGQSGGELFHGDQGADDPVRPGPSLKACCMASSASSLAIAAMIIPWSRARIAPDDTPVETSTESRNPRGV